MTYSIGHDLAMGQQRKNHASTQYESVRPRFDRDTRLAYRAGWGELGTGAGIFGDGGPPLGAIDELQRGIRRSHVLIADDVADEYALSDKQEYSLRDFPNWAPPWGEMFVEWKIPKRMKLIDGWKDNPMWPDSYAGFAVIAHKIDVIAESSMRLSAARHRCPPFALNLIDSLEAITNSRRDDDEWVLSSRLIMGAKDKVVAAPFAAMIVVSRNGEYQRTGVSGRLAEMVGEDESAAMLHILGMALSLCHCKNCIPRDVSKANRLRSSVQKRARVTRLLKMSEVRLPTHSPPEHSGDGSGVKRSVHICRGHFATYTDEKPLFGKYSGTYWVPDHVRGSKSQGITISRHRA